MLDNLDVVALHLSEEEERSLTRWHGWHAGALVTVLVLTAAVECLILSSALLWEHRRECLIGLALFIGAACLLTGLLLL
jgi:hypothetical protein